jgi:hypothetical protein
MDYEKELSDFIDGKTEVSLGEVVKKIDEIAQERAIEYLAKVQADKINSIVELRALEMVTQTVAAAMIEKFDVNAPIVVNTIGAGLEDHCLCMAAFHQVAVKACKEVEEEEEQVKPSKKKPFLLKKKSKKVVEEEDEEEDSEDEEEEEEVKPTKKAKERIKERDKKRSKK